MPGKVVAFGEIMRMLSCRRILPEADHLRGLLPGWFAGSKALAAGDGSGRMQR